MEQDPPWNQTIAQFERLYKILCMGRIICSILVQYVPHVYIKGYQIAELETKNYFCQVSPPMPTGQLCLSISYLIFIHVQFILTHLKLDTLYVPHVYIKGDQIELELETRNYLCQVSPPFCLVST